MPKLFAVSIVLILLLGAGYGAIQAARSIPWDCSDWQAYAHADRATAILESLAENRGKTLYCGVDQSDTFGKAETWAAGKDRNERDDTVYFGERGQFRGFIAAQEGWLTEGESGITGQSIAVIFEFPKEERRRVKRTKRISIGNKSDRAVRESCHNATPPGDLLCSAMGAATGDITVKLGAELAARNRWLGQPDGADNWGLSGGRARIDWQTHRAAEWQALADTLAAAACRERGYRLDRAAFGPGHDDRKGSGGWSPGDELGWFYTENQSLVSGSYKYQAWQSRTWTATCTKKVRRNR